MHLRVSLVAACVLLISPSLASALTVTSFAPGANAINVARGGTVTIEFDAPLVTGSVTAGTLRVWGQQRGTLAGATAFSNGNRTLTFTPSLPFFPGEMITVNLARTIASTNATTLRAAGYAWQFTAAAGAGPGAMEMTRIDTVSVRTSSATTTLYGGAFADLNEDGWVDYMAINETSDDVRVLLNRADGSGKLGPVLTPTNPVGHHASPSEVGDFDNDGDLDLATSNADANTVSILLGNGNGTFAAQQSVAVPTTPHGIAALDIDGDADIDLVVSTEGGNTMARLINNGSGVFGSVTSFDSGGNGEYALATGDMNGDAIMDLVVGTRNDNRIRVLTGNGDTTFTAAANVAAGGLTWKLVLGDVDGDGDLDVANVNGQSNNGSILRGNGNGTLQAAVVHAFEGHMVASDLGDIDGDGDLDWVASSFGAGRWYLLTNNGSGTFTQVRVLPAIDNASCASLYDFDNDGDLDMALADEIADVILLYQNGSTLDTLFRNGFE